MGNGTVTELQVTGMTCNNCARHVSEALREVAGVSSVNTSLEEGAATVRWIGNATPSVEKLICALKEAGYGAAEKSGAKSSIVQGWKFNVVLGTAATLPLLVLEWGFGAGLARWYHWLAFALVLPVQVFCGWRFYRGAWLQAKSGRSNMDTLVSLGSTTAFFFSVWGLLAGWNAHLYFMDAAAILTLVSVGHFLEEKASARAASSLRELLNLSPETARKLDAHGVEQTVAVAELRPDDIILLKPGDRAPTDGQVIEGQGSVNEAMLTGESMPVEKSAGGKVFAGTINENGTLRLRVTATGAATALAHIIQIVERAQNSRAEIQRLGDRVSSVFVPIVVLVAIATAVWWGFFPQTATSVNAWLAQFLWHSHSPEAGLAAAVFHAAAVLIIACPCAMGLATPVAIMAGTNAAARRGILIRDGSALEKSGRISAILFDKTGTLTEGKLTVAAIEHFSRADDKLGPALARFSTHPASRAIAGLGREDRLFGNWREISGAGIEATEGADLIRLGRLDWLAEMGVAVKNPWTRNGASVVGLARNEELLSLYALKDQPKARAREMIEVLRRKGYAVYLVTGDNEQTAKHIGNELGFEPDKIFAQVRPEGKLQVVEQVRAAGNRVAFVGDGINDAPALKAADLGIALTNATDVAREQSDIILLKADLHGIPEALGLAQRTLRTIKQNLFWAFFYNALGVPLAALGFISPMFSALAMGLSDLVVIGNALRLKRTRV